MPGHCLLFVRLFSDTIEASRSSSSSSSPSSHCNGQAVFCKILGILPELDDDEDDNDDDQFLFVDVVNSDIIIKSRRHGTELFSL